MSFLEASEQMAFIIYVLGPLSCYVSCWGARRFPKQALELWAVIGLNILIVSGFSALFPSNAVNIACGVWLLRSGYVLRVVYLALAAVAVGLWVATPIRAMRHLGGGNRP